MNLCFEVTNSETGGWIECESGLLEIPGLAEAHKDE